MTTLTITQWLKDPSVLPEDTFINAQLEAHPWFVPARLMQSVQMHRKQEFSPAVLGHINHYAPNWLPAYCLLIQSAAPERKQATPLGQAMTKEKSMEPTAQEVKHEMPLIQPLFTEDYFLHQGVAAEPEPEKEEEDPRTLMVVMSFSEWLNYYKTKTQREEEEDRDKRALKSMWQQEKLAAALGEEHEEIPEEVFEMAVSSIAREEDLVSESLAQILEKQEKWSEAAEMYRKLGLRNPAKSAYFATRAEAAKKRIS
jgi:hypothetical protein